VSPTVASYCLVGNSAAALAAIDWIRQRDREHPIVVVNRERGPAYSRVALPYYVSGERRLESLVIRERVDYARLGVELIEGEPVRGIDPDGEIELASGRKVAFAACLVATGSECIRPPIAGLERVPHHFLWTLEDAVGLHGACETGAATGVVIGGGFIGMLAAEALRKRRMRLTIVEAAPQLMPQLLDPEGASRFAAAVSRSGHDVRLGSAVDSVAPRGSGVEVTLRGGERIPADVLVVATGVRPNLGAIAGGPIRTGKGILVDGELRTSHPRVFAAGDVAEVRDFLSGEPTIHAIWPTAVDQGRIAGANMTGARLAYPGSLGMNVVELFGVTLAEIGRFRETAGDDVKLLGKPSDAGYRKVVVDRDGRLVGALYLGDENGVAEMGVVHHAIKRRERWRDFSPGSPPRFSYAHLVAVAHARARRALA
jgi:NADPH-dependent 2,4-dienoyl-CoA reductase/sulfur reductase-like enzyme